MEHRACLTAVALSIGLLAGCATFPFEPGLANVPALPGSMTIDVHDAIGNAHDSCPRARVTAADPLWHRYPPCAGSEPPSAPRALALAPAAPAGPADDVSRLHLRNLPPCYRAHSAVRPRLALAFCRLNAN
jgi:hypothetical protein